MLLDGSSTIALHWEGAPPWYLPVGLSMAILMVAGLWSVPLVFLCSIIAALLNYHRPLFSWCGIPGAIGIYTGYVGAAVALRRRRVDLARGTLSDIGRYMVAAFAGSVVSTAFGTLSLWLDGRISSAELGRTAVEWWASDALALVAFTPFLVIHAAPRIGRWLVQVKVGHSIRPTDDPAARRFVEVTAQLALLVGTIWMIFSYGPAMPYQPLYLLFIPLIWVAVRHGLSGAVMATFTIGVSMTIAAWATQAQRGSLPRLQLATLTLGLTGLFLGATVTERRRGEQSIRESEKRYRLLFERNLAGVFRTNLEGRILECNPAAAQLLGYESPSEVLKLPVSAIYCMESDREHLLNKFKCQKFVANHEMKLRRKDGEPVWSMANVSLVETDRVGEFILEGTLVNITERKQAEERAQRLAYYDPLTALPNRTLLCDRLSQALASTRRRNTKIALLFVDLDRFKTINDSLGHSVGDLVLQEVADRLKKCTREQDTVARLGGDEFLIVLTDVKDIPDVAIAAERFMDAMTSSFIAQGQSLSVGCSIGISICPDHGTDTETLIKHADSAMYSAKDNGRNSYMFFTADMNMQATERLRLENALRGAIDNNELFLVYQPQGDTFSGQINGLEALVRWQHPELGLVLPDRFIRIAETSGLILRIGDWVLKTACRQARAWQARGLPPVPVAVNVSAVQFRHESFCEHVQSVLQETGLAPKYLELELTESSLLANADLTLSVLARLQNMGVTLAIDDFGTGYSSLSYLKRFPVSKLKIDRSFIRDLGVNQEDAAITTAIISMAKSLNLRVVAEGVENEEQMAFLRARECGGIQGYYFSRPLSVDRITEELFSKQLKRSANASV